jgi:hypothetical protein
MLPMMGVALCSGAAAGETPLHRLRVLAGGDPPPFIQQVRDGARLAQVWRGGRDWTGPRALVMADDSAARTEGNVHFFNLTASPLAIVIGPEKIRLEPGKSNGDGVRHGEGAAGLMVAQSCT